ncbi:MAG: hypothetical protein V4793_19835 [Paraburkholderia tropica]
MQRDFVGARERRFEQARDIAVDETGGARAEPREFGVERVERARALERYWFSA